MCVTANALLFNNCVCWLLPQQAKIDRYESDHAEVSLLYDSSSEEFGDTETQRPPARKGRSKVSVVMPSETSVIVRYCLYVGVCNIGM
jgi:hypothetical protein